MWSYDFKKRTTGDSSGVLSRVQLEEASHALFSAGIRNVPLVVDVLSALSGLGKAEVRFNVEVARKLDDLIAS